MQELYEVAGEELKIGDLVVIDSSSGKLMRYHPAKTISAKIQRVLEELNKVLHSSNGQFSVRDLSDAVDILKKMP